MVFATSSFRFLLMVCVLMAVIAGATKPVLAEIPWQNDPQATIQSARRSGKPILVFVTADWCHYCRRMKQETWSDPSVSKPITENFETLVLDCERDKVLVAKLGLRVFPSTLLYSSNGKFKEERNGFMGASKTMDWLRTSVLLARRPE